MSEVTVRFVPRGDAKLAAEVLSQIPAEQMASAIKPTRRTMQRAIRSVEERALLPEPSQLNRLSVTVDRSQFREIFGSVRLKKRATAKKPSLSITTREKYEAPEKALEVPDALKDTIAFAYVPRPVEFFSPNFVPPIEDIYYLRLLDVQLALNASRCHKNDWRGHGIKVMMADSGFWLHPYFLRSGARLIPTESPGSGRADLDGSGHGTGEAANIFTIAPDCTVYGVKFGNSAAATLETCIALKPDVMTNSWGYNIDYQSREELRQSDPNFYFELLDLENVISTAVEQGICVLFSAGNGHLAFPASHPEVISIGGVTYNEDGSIEASNYASGFESKLYPGQRIPDFCGIVGRSEPAPMSAHIMLPVPATSDLDGENFPSNERGTGWGIFSGTSAACPQVAGAVALLKQINRNLSPSQIRQVLAARSVDVTKGKSATGTRAGPGQDLATGAGLVDALRACGYVAGIA